MFDRPPRHPPAALAALLTLGSLVAPLTAQVPPMPGVASADTSAGDGSEKPAPTQAPTLAEAEAYRTEAKNALEAAKKRLEAALGAEAAAKDEAAKAAAATPTTTGVAATPATTGAESAASESLAAAEDGLVETRIRVLIEGKIETLERVLFQVDQLEGELRGAEGIVAERDAARAALAKMKAEGPEQKPPYSYLFLDEIGDALESQRRRRDAFESALEIAREGIRSAEAQLMDAEARRRRAVERAADASAGAEGLLLKESVKKEESDALQAKVLVGLRRAELETQARRLELIQAEVGALEAKHEWVAARTRFTKDALDKKVAQLEAARAGLVETIKAERTQLAKVSQVWSKLRADASKPDAKPAVKEQEAARRAEIKALRTRVSMHSRWVEWLLAREQVWQRRFELAHLKTPDPDTLRHWRAETATMLEEFDREERLQTALLSDTRKDLLDLEREMEAAEGGKPGWWVGQRKKHLDQILGASLEHLERLEATRREFQKLDATLAERVGGLLTFDYWGEAKTRFRQAWNFELMTVEDRSITVGKLLVALFLVLLGYLLSRSLSSRVSGWAQGRFQLDEGAAAGIESVLFYLMVVGFTMLALQVAGVPVGVFAFVGGALAIGIGFGSQNLMNNFISGLLLLIERPIRVGDQVEVDGTFGQVTRLGARCTRIRTPRNIEVLVPNSRFLESSLINWTLSDRRVRMDIGLGVAYGSDLEKVKEVLLAAAKDHPDVLASPEPEVVFLDHGASSLDLMLKVWVRLRRGMAMDAVPSALRFAIDAGCREADIEIPFPQRDVNFRGFSPLEVVRLSGGDGGGSGEPA